MDNNDQNDKTVQNMEIGSLDDEALDNVSGGNRLENIELARELGVVLDTKTIKAELMKYHIAANLFDERFIQDRFLDTETGKQLQMADVVNKIRTTKHRK